jgi:hypothetical protein
MKKKSSATQRPPAVLWWLPDGRAPGPIACWCSTGGSSLYRPCRGQTRYSSVPVGVALVGVGNFKDFAFAEWAPLDLEADRQAITVEATGRAYRRQPKVIDGPRVDADGAEGLDGTRCADVDVGGR